jgi:hypothetical protein
MNTTIKKKTRVQVSKSDKAATTKQAEVIPAPISDKQYKWFIENGYDDANIPETAKEAFATMEEVFKKQRKARNAAPSDAQLRYLEKNGYNREAMSMRTKGFCASLIYKIKLQKGEIKKTQDAAEAK